ncbi:MAG: NAD(P)/FAD-dependent oxidoreductase [Tyzzerella sp.]|nr:NAD(P)/FAD-dependent oxidoreductase [Tyzzerella sp.]
MKSRNIIVIGGGASGIAAAISAAREGANVIVIEHKDRIGKKILSTGNGRCNLTNENMDARYFRGDDTTIVTEVLNEFGYSQTKQFFEQLGVILKNRQGYIYPISDQASTILDVLRMELDRLKVKVCLEQHVVSAKKNTKGFQIITDKGRYQCDALILATGGKASSVLGSDGSGYVLAKQFGHQISPVVPALVQLKGKGNYFKQVAGVRTHAKVSLYENETFISEDTGELQLTNYGISGIPVFQISRYAAKGLYEKKKINVVIDFIPSMTEDELYTYVNERVKTHGEKKTEDFFVGMFHKKLISMFLKEANIPFSTPVHMIPHEDLKRMLCLCKHFTVVIEGTNDFEQAQVCAGGVRTTEINPKTMESLHESGLYIAGELLDIDGICGGYNLQWAWSTGFIAGENAAKGSNL